MTGGLSGFLRKYSVTVTMIPSIFLMHYGWMRLQNVDSLVQEHERKEFPLLDLYHKLSAKQVDDNIRSFKHQAD